MKKTLVALTAAALAGCATAPRDAFSGAPDYGPPPKDPARVIAAFLEDHMKDPHSAQIGGVRGPGPTYFDGGLLQQSAYGWGICFSANLKNAFGGYTGSRLYALLYRNGEIFQSLGVSRNLFDDIRTQNFCRSIPNTPVGPSSSASSTAEAAVSSAAAQQQGASAYQVERMPEVRACNAKPSAFLNAKGPGFETYLVSCANVSGMVEVRCEYGQCRVMR